MLDSFATPAPGLPRAGGAATFGALHDYVRSTLYPCAFGDQAIANAFFLRRWPPRRRERLAPFEHERLHFGYNLQPRATAAAPTATSDCLRRRGLEPDADVFAIHWTGVRKPWLGEPAASADAGAVADPVEARPLEEYAREHRRWRAELAAADARRS